MIKSLLSLTLTTSALLISAAQASAQVCENGICRIRPNNSAVQSRQYNTTSFDTLNRGYRQSRPPQGCVGANCQCGPNGVCGPDCECGPNCVNCSKNHQQRDYGVNFAPNYPSPASGYRSGTTGIRAPQPQSRFDRVSFRSQIEWQADFERAADVARRTQRPLLVRVGAKWCGYCNQMKQQTFADERIVADISQGFVAVDIDADQNPELVKRMRVQSLPTTLVMSPDLRILDRQEGFRSASQLGRVLSRFVQRAELMTPTKVVCR